MKAILCALVLIWPLPLIAQDRELRLAAPETLVSSGFLKHLLPRFSLKTGVRVILVDPQTQSDASFGDVGTPVFRGPDDRLWHLSHEDTTASLRFADWLESQVGRSAIEGFAPEGTRLFTATLEIEAAPEVIEISGDARAGERLSLALCGRCHVINETNKGKDMGASPSFALLRGFRDWQDRFEAFYALNPHPSFTQVEDVTEPFPPHLPSPIAPLEMQAKDIQSILAYVATLEPADLGAPLQLQ